MGLNSVRIEKITIRNFKNVRYGSVSLENTHKKYRTSILGIYGQNGSGKTSIIDALLLLKQALSGKEIPAEYADYINVDAEKAEMEFCFVIRDGDEVYNVWYAFTLCHKSDDEYEENTNQVEISDEILSYSCIAGENRVRKSVLIDTGTSDVFRPKQKFNELVGNGGTDITDFLVQKKLAQATSRSFIFSKYMINQFRRNCQDETYLMILNSLYRFGNRELFVINTGSSALVSLDTLPLSYKYADDSREYTGSYMIPLDSPVPVLRKDAELLEKIIQNMNIVLEQLVPGLTISIKCLGTGVDKDGQPVVDIQLMSKKNSREIPLRYESEGIKKIVSILQLLIVVYNNPSMTVAIDELDDGIFEYLLGELLGIISEKGKGQLIFTSHNLRPLETLDKGFIAFTTTNPDNRYIRLTNVKTNNNLRDFYYRDIVLGEQKEELYKPTNNYEIALAFREAGEAIGS